MPHCIHAGVIEIDRQHAELLSLLGRLRETARIGDPEKISRQITNASLLLQDHFVCEERHMVGSSMPQEAIDLHRHEHVRLLELLTNYFLIELNGKIQSPIQFVDTLNAEIATHIKEWDAKLSPYLVQFT